MTEASGIDNTSDLYRINDVLTSLASELGVPTDEEWEDEVLNDLVHSVEQVFRERRNAAAAASILTVSDHIRNKTSKTIAAIVSLTPGAWSATRGRKYAELPEDVRDLGCQINARYDRKFALMFMNLHGLDAGAMEVYACLDFTDGESGATIVVPDFSEYSEQDLIGFYNFMAHHGIITEDVRDDVLEELAALDEE